MSVLYTINIKSAGATFLFIVFSIVVFAQDASTADSTRRPSIEDINKAKQNPVSGLKSVFLQDALLPIGDGHANAFSVQPVWPFRIGNKWKLITYTIIPFQSIPKLSPETSGTSGLGNILWNGFIRPIEGSKGPVTWGIGPAVQLPTRTNSMLGSDRVSLGPAALLYVSTKKIAGGLVVQNYWSIGGTGINKVNLFSTQYIAYYNFSKGWYLESNASVTANWRAASSNIWTVPLGGGPGKTFEIGRSKRFYSAALQGFYNVARPDLVGPWMIMAQFQIMFSM